MKILLAIPSKKRPQVLMANAMKWVPYVGLPWAVFLEREDVEEYRAAGVPQEHIIVLPESNCGLGYSKEIIKGYAEKQGYEAIFKIDDDIKGWTNYRTRLNERDSAIRISDVIEECVAKFESDPLVAGFSFPYAFQMFEEYDFKKTKRVQTAYLFRTEFFHADRRISVHEDFAVGLNAVVKGRLVLWHGRCGIVLGVQVGGGKKDTTGGHQALNRVRGAEACMPYLLEMYPALKFRQVDKPWKSEPDLRSLKAGLYP